MKRTSFTPGQSMILGFSTPRWGQLANKLVAYTHLLFHKCPLGWMPSFCYWTDNVGFAAVSEQFRKELKAIAESVFRHQRERNLKERDVL